MEHVGWDTQMEVGIPLMDLAHRALIAQIAHQLELPDQDFNQGLALLVEHLETDFREEEQLMEEIDYPGIAAHREQHARVLATLHGLASDDLAAARRAVSLLPLWFQAHLATMDTALAIGLQMAGNTLGLPGDAPLLAGGPAM